MIANQICQEPRWVWSPKPGAFVGAFCVSPVIITIQKVIVALKGNYSLLIDPDICLIPKSI